MTKSKRIREFANEYWNSKSKDKALFDLFSENMLYRTVIGTRIGTASYKSYGETWLHAFPDYQIQVEQIEEFDNTVIATCKCQGTHLNPFLDTPDDTKTLESTDFSNRFPNITPTGNKLHAKITWVLIFQGTQVEKLITLYDKSVPYRQLGLYHPNERVALANALKKKLPTLTTRELECLAIGFCGFSAKHTAEVLKISHRTVETHLQNAYQKLAIFGKQQCLEMMHKNHTLTLWIDLGISILQMEKKWIP